MKSDLQEPCLSLAMESELNVLILGPTGSGKSTLARRIHENCARSSGPFIQINLGGVHEGTLESDLFGHERGAYTGAHERRVGRLELANGGTVFLDEIGELSLALQVRLLEFLNSGRIVRVGGNQEIALDVRVIAATHRDLNLYVKNGLFREDLFHRLRVIQVRVKSLRERGSEFDQLLHFILERESRCAGKKILRLHESVAELFESYAWPGNIRELKNVIAYAVAAADLDEIGLSNLPIWFLEAHANERISDANFCDRDRGAGLGVAEIGLSFDFKETLRRVEREYLVRALAHYHWRINRTAREINLNKNSLIRRIRSHNLKCPDSHGSR